MIDNSKKLLQLTKCETILELANKVGVCKGTVTHWCSYNRTPRKDVMVKMAKSTKTELVDLIHFFYFEVDNEKS